MTIHFGFVPASTVLYIPFHTFNSSGASVTITGLAVTDIEVYKNGSTTQRASDAGYALLDTDGIDFDGLTGIHGFSIDTSDNTDSGFYAAGSMYWVVVSAVTVDSQTVSFVAATFFLGPQQADVRQFGGTAGTFASGRPEVNMTHIGGSAVSTSTAQLGVNVVNFGGSAGTFASGRPEVNTSHWGGTAVGSASVRSDVISISGDTAAADNAESFFDGTGYKDIDNEFVLRSATAQAGAAGTITLDASASASDGFYNNTIIQILSGTGANQSRIISDYVGSTKVAAVNGNWATNPDNTSVFAIRPFGAIPGASAPTAAEVADAVWDEARAGHVASGSFGEYVPANVTHFGGSAGTFASGRPEVNTSHWAGTAVGSASVRSDVISISGDATAADNLELAFDDTAGAVPWMRIIDQGTAQAATASTLQLRAAASFADDTIIGATIMVLGSTQGYWQSAVITDYVSSTDTATISPDWAVTPSGTITYKVIATPPAPTSGSLPSVNVAQWAGGTVATPTQTGVPEVDLTHIGGAAVSTSSAQLGVNVVNAAGTAWGSGAITAASIASDAITAAKIAAGAIDRATFAADTGLVSVRGATAQAGAAGTITLDASASATNDIYNNLLVYITGGTGAGQTRFVTDYVGSTKVASVSPNWTTTPDNTSTFAILPSASVWDQVTADHLASGTTGNSLNAAGSAGDPWSTALPGAYGSGTAGNILGNRLVGTIATGTHNPQSGDAYARLGAPAGASIAADIATVNTVVDAILADTGTDGVVVSAAAIRTAVGLASANLDTQLGNIVADTNELQTDWANGGRLDLILDARASQTSVDTIDGIVDSILADTGTDGVVVNAAGLASDAANEIADALLDRSAAVETGLTLRQALRLIVAATAGKLSGAATSTVTIRNAVADSKARITATVDGDGNRSAITYDVS